MKIRVLSLLICVSLLVSVLPGSSSASSIEGSNTSEFQAITSLICDVFPAILNSSSGFDSLAIGSQIKAYRVNNGALSAIDYSLYPIYADNAIVALATLSYNNEQKVQVSYAVDYAPELQDFCLLYPDSSYAIIIAAEGIFALDCSGHFACISARNTSCHESISLISPTSVSIEYGIIAPCYVVSSPRAQTYTSSSVQAMSLNITRVPNASDPCGQVSGLCWASCIAMISNYYKSTSYDALSIHNIFGCLGLNPSSTKYQNALSDLALYTYGPYTSDLNYNTMVNLIQGNRIPFIHLDSQGEGGNHVVVGKGYYWNGETSASKYFYIVDPNSGTRLVSFPSSGTVQLALDGYSYSIDYYIGTA